MKKPTPAPVAHRKTKAKKKKGIPPRITHGTRVAFRITCERCSTEETLTFVPKNADELLCSTCAAEEFGEDWDKGRMPRSAEYEFDCAACGRSAVMRSKPEDAAGLLCMDCMKGVERAEPERIAGAVKVGKKRGLMKRKGGD